MPYECALWITQENLLQNEKDYTTQLIIKSHFVYCVLLCFPPPFFLMHKHIWHFSVTSFCALQELQFPFPRLKQSLNYEENSSPPVFLLTVVDQGQVTYIWNRVKITKRSLQSEGSGLLNLFWIFKSKFNQIRIWKFK